MNPATVAQEVQTAFSSVTRPAPEFITTHRCEECNELRDDFAPYEVDQLPDEILRKHIWDLALLSDEAKQYFLPAWLKASLTEPESDATDALLAALDSDHRWAPPKGYSTEQRSAINRWLEFIASGVEAVAAAHASNTWLRRTSEA